MASWRATPGTLGALSPCLAAPTPGDTEFITLGDFMRQCRQRFADTALLEQTIRDTLGKRLYKQLAEAPCVCASEIYGQTNGAASMLRFMFNENCLKSSLAGLMKLTSDEHLCCRTTHRRELFPIDPTCLAGEIQTWLVLREFRCYILGDPAPEWLDSESDTEDECFSDDGSFESDDDAFETDSYDDV